MSSTPDSEKLAQLADLVLNVGRLIRARTPSSAQLVPLTETERQVMRLVDLHPACSPSDIAIRGRMQRTNVSTALRSLEDKRMVRRTTTGRQVSVTPTPLAATNLQALHDTWSELLGGSFHADPDSLAACIELLGTLEEQLTDPVG